MEKTYLEETRQEINSLERMNVLLSPQGVEQNRRDEEENSVGEESETLQPLPSDELVVNEQGGHVVSNKSNTTVEQVPVPSDNNGLGSIGTNDLDEGRLEKLVSVESEIVGEPGESSSEQTSTKVTEDELQRGNVVTRLVDTGVLFGTHQRGTRISTKRHETLGFRFDSMSGKRSELTEACNIGSKPTRE
jgi:hypothetical protein